MNKLITAVILTAALIPCAQADKNHDPEEVADTARAYADCVNAYSREFTASYQSQNPTPEEKAEVDKRLRSTAAEIVARQYDSALNGAGRGTGLLGLMGRKKIKKNRAEREPELIKISFDKLSQEHEAKWQAKQEDIMQNILANAVTRRCTP